MPHGNPEVGFSNAMAHGETSLVVGSGWNSPLAYIRLSKGDISVKILRSRINGGWVARRLITRGSTSCTFSLLHFHACVYFLVFFEVTPLIRDTCSLMPFGYVTSFVKVLSPSMDCL